MPVTVDEIRELSQEELIELVAEIWEVRPGWRTTRVSPGDEIKLELDNDIIDIAVPEIGHPSTDSELTIDILAIQESPYPELEYICVHQGSEGDATTREFYGELRGATSGYKVSKVVVVTSDSGIEETVDERLHSGYELVDGVKICELINSYSDHGLDPDKYIQ